MGYIMQTVAYVDPAAASGNGLLKLSFNVSKEGSTGQYVPANALIHAVVCKANTDRAGVTLGLKEGTQDELISGADLLDGITQTAAPMLHVQTRQELYCTGTVDAGGNVYSFTLIYEIVEL